MGYSTDYRPTSDSWLHANFLSACWLSYTVVTLFSIVQCVQYQFLSQINSSHGSASCPCSCLRDTPPSYLQGCIFDMSHSLTGRKSRQNACFLRMETQASFVVENGKPLRLVILLLTFLACLVEKWVGIWSLKHHLYKIAYDGCNVGSYKKSLGVLYRGNRSENGLNGVSPALSL